MRCRLNDVAWESHVRAGLIRVELRGDQKWVVPVEGDDG